ncbi:hypothetical protein C3V36_00610 [Lachnospiraceae bacterium oral taxon 500]|nr:hypothetical protein C3V36_00610 [Lachnospiraceae bacterium oral taxon 500]
MMQKEKAEWKKDSEDFQYVHAELDENILPRISGEDLNALSDYPAIYIYVSNKDENDRRYYYIGQTINVFNRAKQHNKKLAGKSYDERFSRFKNGEYFVFYGKKVAQNLNYIEKTLILTFVREFNIINFVDLNKDDGYVSQFLANRDLGNESGKFQELRQEIEDGIINPILSILKDKEIIEAKFDVKKVTSSLFMDSPFFELDKNQQDILNKIIEGHKGLKEFKVSLIKGAPGTGKTILLLHLIARLKQENPNYKIAIFLRNIQRGRFKQILTSYGLNPSENKIDIVTFNKLAKTDIEYDYIIVDEAQRTTKLRENMIYPTGAKNEADILKEINGLPKEASSIEKEVYDKLKFPSTLHFMCTKTKNMIVAYDDGQRLRDVDNDRIYKIFESYKECEKYELRGQLRILHGKEKEFTNKFIELISAILCVETEDKTESFKNLCTEEFEKLCKEFKELNRKNNYLKIAETVDEWKEYVLEKWEKFPDKKSVRLSGYCKPVKKSKEKVKEFIDEMFWTMNGKKWRSYNEQSLDVGNVYDIQGFDVDFASVYIGEDLYFDEVSNSVKGNKDKYYDSGTKKGLKDVEKYIKSAYFVLLTRAVHGQMIYVENDKLRNFLIDKLVDKS